MNKSTFGKTMKNLRKRINARLAKNAFRLEKMHN